MATQAEINAHDKAMSSLAQTFARGLRPLFQNFYDQLLTLDNPSRVEIITLFNQFRTYLAQSITQLNTVVDSNIAVNNSALGTELGTEASVAISSLTNEVRNSVNAQLDEEQNTILNALVIASVLGSYLDVVKDQRKNSAKAINRLNTVFEFAIRSFDGALTLIRGRGTQGVTRYRYVGGIIPESRDFCVRHNNKVYTERQIRRIWLSQTWGGKRPGDPFVVRGGYNCRHMFVAEPTVK